MTLEEKNLVTASLIYGAAFDLLWSQCSPPGNQEEMENKINEVHELLLRWVIRAVSICYSEGFLDDPEEARNEMIDSILKSAAKMGQERAQPYLM